MNKKVYLAGGQQYSNDFGVGWRRDISKFLCDYGFDVFDPTYEENPIKVKHGDDWKLKCNTDSLFKYKLGGELIDYDYGILKQCSAMLVFWDMSAVMGGGTKSEITWSKQLDIPCYVVLDSVMKESDLPLWTCGGIRNPENVFSSFEDFKIKFLNDFCAEGVEAGHVFNAHLNLWD